MAEKQINPGEYGYAGNEEITINSSAFQELFMFVERLLDNETKPMFPEKYMFVDTETSKPISKVTKKNEHKARKVVDPKKTMASEPTIYRTELGIGLLKVKNYLAEVHYKNIEKGVAKHRDELFPQPKQEDEQTVAEQV